MVKRIYNPFPLQVRGFLSLGSLSRILDSEGNDDTFVWSLTVCKVLLGTSVWMCVRDRVFQIYQH